MDTDDPDRRSSSRRLTLSTSDFDDYLIALMAMLRNNLTADRILSGELQHPLIAFQVTNSVSLQALNIPFVPPEALRQDPVSPYNRWVRLLTEALLQHATPVPVVLGLQQLQQDQEEFRAAERHIYSTVTHTGL